MITFDSSNFAVIAYEILKNRLFDEKKLLGNHYDIKGKIEAISHIRGEGI